MKDGGGRNARKVKVKLKKYKVITLSHELPQEATGFTDTTYPPIKHREINVLLLFSYY